MSYGLNELAEELHRTSVSKGFYVGTDMTLFSEQCQRLALIHSEVTETLEALRKHKGSLEVVKEISDILVRTLDFYEALRIDGVVTESLDEVFEGIKEANKARPYLHGNLRG